MARRHILRSVGCLDHEHVPATFLGPCFDPEQIAPVTARLANTGRADGEHRGSDR